MKKILLFIVMIIGMSTTYTLVGCGHKASKESFEPIDPKDSIVMFLDTSITERLSRHELAIIMESDSAFADFYRVIEDFRCSLDDVGLVEYSKIKYAEVYEYYKLRTDSAYWSRPVSVWTREWNKKYSKSIEIQNFISKANIRVRVTDFVTYGGLYVIGYNIYSDINCSVYMNIFFHPASLNRGYNDTGWFDIKDGYEESTYLLNNSNGSWLNAMTYNYGKIEAVCTVYKIRYKGKEYDSSLILPYIPDKEVYIEKCKMDSLKSLNGNLYEILGFSGYEVDVD